MITCTIKEIKHFSDSISVTILRSDGITENVAVDPSFTSEQVAQFIADHLKNINEVNATDLSGKTLGVVKPTFLGKIKGFFKK